MAHKFSHLGKAPYTLAEYRYNPPVQDERGNWTGGDDECDHCGTPISHVFICRDATGKTFRLGSVHVEQLKDDGLTKAVREKTNQIKRDAREAKQREVRLQRAQEWADRREKEAAKVKAEYERLTPVLANLPHPNPYFASQGKTKLDYIDYFLNGDNWTNSKLMRELRGHGAQL